VHWTCRQAADGRVLDVGCSQGLTALLLAREGHEVVGVDLQQESIDFAQGRREQEPPVVRDRLTFLVAEARRLPFGDGEFDTVVMGELLEHLIDPAPVLDEAARVLRPEGRLVVTTPYGLFPSQDHKDPLYLRDLLGLMRGRFEIRELELLDRLLGVVAVRATGPDEPGAELLRRALEVAEERLRVQDETVRELRANARAPAPPPRPARPKAPKAPKPPRPKPRGIRRLLGG
jgi:2-polyprenyl-6-hydroxyphenyl methylase/3-demethylubiquinone-9 3-methyltransferase